MKVDKLVPEVYYKESRDFAYAARLFEVLFNYMKTSADCVNLGIDHENIDSNLVDLCANTLGFDLRHNYINKDLIIIASAFSTLLKNKGTLTAVNLAVRLLLNSQKVKDQEDLDFCEYDEKIAEIKINVPDKLNDIVLLEDLFDYILPAGVTYKFIKYGNDRNVKETEIKTSTESCTIEHNKSDADLGIIESEPTTIETTANNAAGSIYTGLIVSSLPQSEVQTSEDKENK